MIIPSQYKNKTVAVLGLGKSGLSAERALKEAGAHVLVGDDQSDRTDLVDLTKADWAAIDLLVMSPGIPHTFPKPHPVADLAREHGVDIVCDVELLCQSQPNAQYVAITGTNGKSTTTALITHILKTAGFTVQVGGNFGIPALDLDPLDENGVYVLEMSSYQLERTPSLKADVAVWLNISPDHLGRHGGLEGYIAAKKNIFNNQGEENYAFIGVDDTHSRTVFDEETAGNARKIAISSQSIQDGGIYIKENKLIDHAFDTSAQTIMDVDHLPTLKGLHNLQNAAISYGAAMALGAAPEWIIKGLESFPGLEHRQENVATFGAVQFINDSKATNADATQKALGAYKDIYWIAGGQAKEGGITSLMNSLEGVRCAYLIGEAENDFAQTLDGHLPYKKCQTLDNATALAFKDAAQTGGVVLLSPACASWDQFTSFEARGDAFKDIVHSLIEEAA